ncbi:hypothetical protein, partial [Phormidium sp. CCY1219]|uniref:hypothetical protein n=1 Tax=Phormidium sp. CCY1219 TaxID=2886104 RepID=UPI002D1F0C26
SSEPVETVESSREETTPPAEIVTETPVSNATEVVENVGEETAVDAETATASEETASNVEAEETGGDRTPI